MVWERPSQGPAECVHIPVISVADRSRREHDWSKHDNASVSGLDYASTEELVDSESESLAKGEPQGIVTSDHESYRVINDVAEARAGCVNGA